MDGGQRDLGGRDRPQAVALEVVGVVGELRELARGRERFGGDQGGRANLLVAVGVSVQGVLQQRSRQGRPAPPLHREHGAGDLHGALVVQDSVTGSELPVRDPLMLTEAVRIETDDLHHRVVGVTAPVGGIGGGGVGDAEEELVDFVVHFGGLIGQSLFGRSQLPATDLEVLGLGYLTVLAKATDLLGHHLYLIPEVVSLGGQCPLASVQLHHRVDL